MEGKREKQRLELKLLKCLPEMSGHKTVCGFSLAEYVIYLKTEQN